jgi:hypothetical protein
MQPSMYVDDPDGLCIASLWCGHDHGQSGLVLFEQRTGQESTHACLHVSLERARVVLDFLRQSVHHLTAAQRHRLVSVMRDHLSPQIATLSPSRIAQLLLSCIDDLPGQVGVPYEAFVLPVGIPPLPEEALHDLRRLYVCASRKMPLEWLMCHWQACCANMTGVDVPLGDGASAQSGDVLSIAMRARRTVDEDRQSCDVPVCVYDVASQVRRKIDDLHALRVILDSFPCKPMPDLQAAVFSGVTAEMVPLDRVCGGVTLSHWTVSTSANRGLPHIFKLSQAFARGEMGVGGRGHPVSVFCLNGEYFLSRDGRHRVAALKALGVEQVPMLVTHASLGDHAVSS